MTFMLQVKDDNMTTTIETTIGDLICAIQDAAQEACIADAEVSAVTQVILMDLLQRSSGGAVAA